MVNPKSLNYSGAQRASYYPLLKQGFYFIAPDSSAFQHRIVIHFDSAVFSYIQFPAKHVRLSTIKSYLVDVLCEDSLEKNACSHTQTQGSVLIERTTSPSEFQTFLFFSLLRQNVQAFRLCFSTEIPAKIFGTLCYRSSKTTRTYTNQSTQILLLRGLIIRCFCCQITGIFWKTEDKNGKSKSYQSYTSKQNLLK